MKANSSAYSIGRARRDDQKQKVTVPGPGAYQGEILAVDHILLNDGPKKAPGGKMGKEERQAFQQLMKAAISPGPGAPYNVERATKIYQGRRSPRLTISTKFPNSAVRADASKTPGPGAYADSMNTTFNGTKGYTIGMQMRLGNLMSALGGEKLPGPGSYNLDKRFPSLGTGKHIGPIFSFPKGDRSVESVKRAGNLPDPASYTPKLKNAGPSITIAIKTPMNNNTHSRASIPGPGAYEIQRSFDKIEKGMLHRVPSTSNGGMRSNKNLLGGIKTSMAFSNMDELAEGFGVQVLKRNIFKKISLN